jgi:hypothetical protein
MIYSPEKLNILIREIPGCIPGLIQVVGGNLRKRVQDKNRIGGCVII